MMLIDPAPWKAGNNNLGNKNLRANYALAVCKSKLIGATIVA
mgnify:CR=1 FL=1